MKDIIKLIGWLCLIAVITTITVWWFSKEINKNRGIEKNKIDSLMIVNKNLQIKNDSLIFINQTIEIQNKELRGVIEKKIEDYEILKRQKNEEINHIVSLPLDDAILFFSREISKENHN